MRRTNKLGRAVIERMLAQDVAERRKELEPAKRRLDAAEDRLRAFRRHGTLSTVDALKALDQARFAATVNPPYSDESRELAAVRAYLVKHHPPQPASDDDPPAS